MMIDFRQVRANDWPEIINLANGVFQEATPMEVSFPLLFNASNRCSYVAVSNHEVIGFIGVLPEELHWQGDCYLGSRIGAVCVSQSYQGQGVGRSLFRLMKKEAQQLDFVLVSGQGKLYLSEGCELFGQFKQFIIPGQGRQMAIKAFSGEVSELLAIHRLRSQQVSYFGQSPAHLQQLIAAQSLATLFGGTQQIFLSFSGQQLVAYVVTGSRYEDGEITEVFEMAGEAQELLALLQQLALTLPNLRCRIQGESELSRLLEAQIAFETVNNAGTILYVNEKVKGVPIPHTWDLGFL